MAFYKVTNTDWVLGGKSGKWYAFKGLNAQSPSGTKADGGPFKTRKDAVNWINQLEGAATK